MNVEQLRDALEDFNDLTEVIVRIDRGETNDEYVDISVNFGTSQTLEDDVVFLMA